MVFVAAATRTASKYASVHESRFLHDSFEPPKQPDAPVRPV